MKKNILLLIFALCLIPMVHAEISLWDYTGIKSNESIVYYHAFYSIDDTSNALLTTTKPIDLFLRYTVEPLPYNLTAIYPQYPNAYVDWCNFTIAVSNNQFDPTTKNIINTTTTNYNYFFENTGLSFGTLQYQLRNKDSIVATMACHYTNPSTLFLENALFGRFSTYFPAFECTQCGEHDFEELTHANDNIEQRLTNETQIYTNIQNIVKINYQLWFYIIWFLKIALVLFSVSLIFIGVYYIYKFMTEVSKT